MNIFELDYLNCVITLLKEAFSFKKYKAMHPVLAVFTGIFMLPFVIGSSITAMTLIAVTFCFKVTKLPIDFLHDLMKSEGKDVHPATQFIIYFLSWSVVFSLYATLSLSLVVITVLYAFLSLETYIWTLGGYKFHALIGAAGEKIAIRARVNYRPKTPLIFIIVCAVILALEVVLYFTVGIAPVLALYAAYLLFAVLYVALAMTKNNVADDDDVPDFLHIERIDV